MNLQITRWGNSLAMRIPADITRRFGLREGDRVEAQFTVDGALTIRPAGWSRRQFAASLAAGRDVQPLGRSVMQALRQSARY